MGKRGKWEIAVIVSTINLSIYLSEYISDYVTLGIEKKKAGNLSSVKI